MIVDFDLFSVQLALPLIVEHPSILSILLLNRYYLRLTIEPATPLSSTCCHRPASSSRPTLVATLTLLKVVEVRVRVLAPRQLLILLLEVPEVQRRSSPAAIVSHVVHENESKNNKQ